MSYYDAPALSSSVVGFKPSKLIPESQKNETWLQETADWCIAQADINRKKVSKSYFDMYNGIRDSHQLEYITRTFGIDFPAKIKHIPLIRPKLNRLIGEEQERGVSFELVSVDTDSLDERKKDILDYVMKMYIKFQRNEITEEDFMKQEKYLKRSFRTSKEINIYHMIKEYVLRHRLHETFSDCMINKLVTGQEYGRVKLDRTGEDPTFDSIPDYQIYHASNDTKWVSDCDWAIRAHKKSSTEVLDTYGEQLTHDQKEKMFNYRELYGKETAKMGGGTTMDDILDEPMDLSEYNSWENDLFDVYELEFKSIRKVPVRTSPNKFNPESPFIKVLTEDEYATMPNKRKKEVSFRYMEDLWRVTRIGPDMFVQMGKVQHPERDQTQPSKTKLTFEGLTHSGPTAPFSLVKTTWDIQMLYDIMHFHKENLIAMSGTKGTVMDLAKMPDFGYGNDTEEGHAKNLQMFMYYKKMGTMFVDSSKDRLGSFNQLGAYDDSVGNGLGVIMEVIRHLDETAGNIININRQRSGMISERDGKGNTQQAIDQSTLGTEPIFNEHDDFKDRILTKIVNLSTASYRGGKKGAYMDQQFQQYMYTVSPEFTMGDFNIFINNRMADRRTMEELKMIASKYADQGLLPFEHAIDIFTTGSLKEMQTILKEEVKASQDKIAQQQQQAAEVEQQVAQAQSQMEQAKFELELQKMQSDIQIAQQELVIKEREVGNDFDIDNRKLVLDSKRVDLEALQIKYDPKSAEVRNE